MSHSSKNLESYKTEIISLFQNNNISAAIIIILKNKYDFEITDHTIESCLQSWEIHKWNCTTVFNTALHAQIKILFFKIDLEKNEIHHALQNKRFEIILRNLKKLC